MIKIIPARNNKWDVIHIKHATLISKYEYEIKGCNYYKFKLKV